MPELKAGCVQPTRGPITPKIDSSAAQETTSLQEASMLVQVGNDEPDFEATAFLTREGFKPIRLSDYKGKWIVLCFYPGDFTYV